MNEMDYMRCYRCGCDGVYKIIELTMVMGNKIRSGICESCLPHVISMINKKDNIILISEKDILIKRGYMKSV